MSINTICLKTYKEPSVSTQCPQIKAAFLGSRMLKRLKYFPGVRGGGTKALSTLHSNTLSAASGPLKTALGNKHSKYSAVIDMQSQWKETGTNRCVLIEHTASL